MTSVTAVTRDTVIPITLWVLRRILPRFGECFLRARNLLMALVVLSDAIAMVVLEVLLEVHDQLIQDLGLLQLVSRNISSKTFFGGSVFWVKHQLKK